MWNTNCSFCKICICLTLSNPSAFNECTAISIQFLASLGRIRDQEHYKVLLFSFFFFMKWSNTCQPSCEFNSYFTKCTSMSKASHLIKTIAQSHTDSLHCHGFHPGCSALSISGCLWHTWYWDLPKTSMKTVCLLFLKNFQKNMARLVHLTSNKIQNIYLSFTKSMPLNSLYHLKFLGGSVRF